MDLRHLRYFIALCERLSFTAAAKQVHVSQSTLSHQIRQLEAELQVELFHRKGQKVTVSEAGETLRAHAAQALASVDAGTRAIKSLGQTMAGTIRLGVTPTFNLRVIPDSITEFFSTHPEICFQVEEVPANEIVEGVREGRLDLGIAYAPTGLDLLTFEPLYEEEMMLVVSPQHRFGKRRRVRMIELHHERLVLLQKSYATRQMLDEWFASVRTQPFVVAEMNTVGPALELVRRMPIATIVSERLAGIAPDLRAIALENPTPTRMPGILRRSDMRRSAVATAFAAVVRQASFPHRISGVTRNEKA